MKKERVTREELLAAARAYGVASMMRVSAIVLKTDGSLTVLPPSNDTTGSTLGGISR